MSESDCVFCTNKTERRTIRRTLHARSLVPKHQFRSDHCLVIPNRHITTTGELNADEAAELLTELGRLGMLIDKGFGTGLMQKYQPLQAENGIKVNHLHFHVFPRIENEEGLFPVPSPNSFDGLRITPEQEILRLIEVLK